MDPVASTTKHMSTFFGVDFSKLIRKEFRTSPSEPTLPNLVKGLSPY